LIGAGEIGVPAFVSTLCICIVFVPMFFLSGVAKFLFVPMAEAVVFAMIASYILSRTFVPTMMMLLMRTAPEHHTDRPSVFQRLYRRFDAEFERIRSAYAVTLSGVLIKRKTFAFVFLLFTLASGLLY